MFRKLLVAIVLVMVFSPAFAQVHVFVTSGDSTGNLGGLAGADATCTAAATGAGLTGTWTAWLSTSTTDASTRILDGEYQLLDGTVVATSLADLTDGSLSAAINLDESMASAASGNAWTGTLATGLASTDTCSDWTDGTDASSTVIGDTDNTNGGWTELASTNPCDFQRRLYCFADVGMPVAPDPVQVFVTSGEFTGNFPGGVGLVGADASCTDAATAAGLSGTWTAWLSDDTTDAVDRILDSGSGYQLLDGTVIADNLADLLDGTLDNPINTDETGTTIPGSFEVWTGTDTDGTNSGVGTCANWTSNLDQEVAQSGRADAANVFWTDNAALGEENCDVFNRLYCFADQEVPVELQEFSVE